ncbi:PREDICTED: high affinity immunoglobulin epsilon receptor subunit alpha [Galeopterus variegatus]|uniref:high affinity immunoglobulin epsilon receptor subunit alpha n=1 Tax=Galeopterus variegatus TaxID=482537 RepID=UPI0004D093A0|nr:PREDICTED: high affinity immunoglobulin epsilon receptor subunit alpha [Galeopterus variegatus]
MLAVTWKSVISLSPPWNRIFKGENVTLTCNGKNFLEVNSTKWTHNGNLSVVTTSSWDILNASIQDSGKYKCQNQNFKESEPVYLEVISDWLLIQASPAVVTEGQSLLLRCHGWKNRDVYKVIYYKNGKALKYWYENHNISIASATTEDSGTYYCKGNLWQLPYTSDPLNITVIKAHQSKYYWLQFFIPLLVVILFAVNTGLYISTQQQFLFLLKSQRTRKGNKLLTS